MAHKSNVQNLVQFRPGGITPEQARINGKKGALASAESKRRRRAMAEGLRDIMSLPPDDPAVAEWLASVGLPPTRESLLLFKVIKKAELGDVEAARFIRDTIGEKPRDGVEIGSMDDKPLVSVDLSKLTDDELRALAARRAEMQGHDADED